MTKKVLITNVHLDLGAGRRGTDMGSSAMHVAGVMPALEKLGHKVVGVHNLGQVSQEAAEVGDLRMRYLGVINEVCRELADGVECSLQQGVFPLLLGGDHSQAIGSIAGVSRYLKRQGKSLGVLWVDAHTDMNTPDSSPSGNIHGMPLATLLGYGPEELTAICGNGAALSPEHVVVFGVRDVDRGEAQLVKKTGIRVFTMSEIDARGAGACLEEAMQILGRATGGIHLSYDLDGSDPAVAPGTGTPVPGGLNFRESHLVCETLARSKRLVSMEVVELNPILDIENRTGKFAVWLIQSALGRTILWN
ncbi:MAG: arginase [Gammaproteobacteria bacterium]|nr:arginase [Gammaproteobacteria bacterium]MDE2273299.1 arginase [Gammaproteobacteria bacterium]